MPSAVSIAECTAETLAFADQLAYWFSSDFHIAAENGELLRAAESHPAICSEALGDFALAIKTSSPFFQQEAGIALVGLQAPGSSAVALALFLVTLPEKIDFSAAADMFGCQAGQLAGWAESQAVWPAASLARMAEAVCERTASEQKIARLENELEDVSDNLSSTYEEISLLYGVTQNLRLSAGNEEIGGLALEWLLDCLPAGGVAISFQQSGATDGQEPQSTLLTAGDCPLTQADLQCLIDYANLTAESKPFVANDRATKQPQWPLAEIEQVILVPLTESGKLFGWLAAVNHSQGLEFGTVEANLLGSIGTILGIHCGNQHLYRQQADLLGDVVKALTSAIDAKDQYTCGHSDRVARFSVRLARELGCDDETLNTMYLGGLLHDIGKIGVSDAVLRKPGKLTDEEFEQIKQHPELGRRILSDLKQLHEVLPIVLYHHEEWDGSGYPQGLAGEEIPFLARIAAVADSYDAMTSDRPYRKGMAEEKVEAIFREGAGTQWDPRVVEAYFSARDDIRAICNSERANLEVQVEQWL